MEESADIGSRRGKVKDVTMLRIDHSDVYIENDRLGEDLLHTIDSIHRSRYAKVMSRDTEINQLKQSLLAMRKVTHRGTSALKRTRKSGSPQRPMDDANRLRKKHAAFNGNANNTKGHGESKMVPGGRNGTRTPSTIKSIEVRMPRTKMKETNDDSDDDDEGSSDSDLSTTDDDDDEDEEDDEDKDSDDDSVEGNNDNVSKPNGLIRRPVSKMARHASSSKTTGQNQESKNDKNNKTKIKRVNPIARIMSHLNIDKLPPSWFTDVVPASDVHFTRRHFVENKNNFNQRNNLQKQSKSRKMSAINSNIRPSTCGGDIFKQDSTKLPMHRQKSQNNLQQPTRPFTTPGFTRSQVGDIDGRGPRSRSRLGTSSNSKSRNYSREVERPQSVLFCEQANHGMKTMRQIKEEEMQATIFNTKSTVDILLEEVREEQKVIDERVRTFVKSLEEEQKSERLRTLMSESSLMNSASVWKLS